MEKTDIAAVVVTYKTKDLLENCLTSLMTDAARADLSLAVVVIDNASRDGTEEMVRERFPQVTLLANTENVGPARAFNQGIARALPLAEKILVSNSDIEVLPGTLQVMQRYLEANPEVDGVNGPLLNPDGTRQFTRTHIWNLRRPVWRRPFPVDFVGTTFALIRSRAFFRVGGYDENYYFYNEDLDWAERAKRSGCLFMCLPEAKVIHFCSQGKIQNLARINEELYRSNIYYFKKFYPRWAWLGLLVLRLELKARSRALRWRMAVGDDPAARKEMEQGLVNLAKACGLMEEEYRREREPQIPYWNWLAGKEQQNGKSVRKEEQENGFP